MSDPYWEDLQKALKGKIDIGKTPEAGARKARATQAFNRATRRMKPSARSKHGDQ